ncbi:unnamed protein product [Rotaria sp. Silwood1]|nr:unnamed protein product [Rotaria sp. Silwood1]CAF3365018.1 unnamed protein product [Rotaria sp. Silwood1]CAF4506357.1 unnamed protein product [Rotaria sp. Silwood1]CAF4746220.1 unnamed protein product [Rotaria sp. Silwood1]
MFSRVTIHLTRRSSLCFHNPRLILPSNSYRHLFELPRRGKIRPWYRRFWPLTIAFSVVSAGVPIGYIIYRDFSQIQLWINKGKSPEENFDENTESVTQSELDKLLSQTQQLLNSELYLNRSSAFIVPIRLFFRTLKLVIILTPLIIYYFFQDKFAPQLYDKWCFALRRSFEYCGPCFIKLGQWMATRPDLFSDQFCSIFNELHSNAPTHSEFATRKLLRENNINIDSSSFDLLSKPIASGAIAQVYRCKIGNRDLIMKIRHPGVQNEIYYDLKILNTLARLLTKFISKETSKWLNIEDNIKSFTKNMLLQTNLMIETKNLQIFERNFQKYKSNIRFPHVDPSLPSTKDILFETYENGQLLNEFMKTCRDTKIRKKLAYLGVNAYLKMLFVDNFVHADLHPGNILVRLDENSPREPTIILIDVGLTSSLNRRDKKNFYDLFRAIVNYDATEAATLLIERAPNVNEIDEQSKIGFRKDMSKLIDSVLKTPLKQLEVGLVLHNVLDLGKKYHIKMESSFTTLALGTIIIEGIGRQLDPDFDFVNAAKPYLQKDFQLVKSYLNSVFQRNIVNTSWWSRLFTINTHNSV